MDSMRSLNRSLPHSNSGGTIQPPEALLQNFKDAAQSLARLYKEATVSHAHARQAGYQDALDDLLIFLDRQELGLGDGEGWKVRRWATERLSDDYREDQRAGDDSEDDAAPSKRGDSPSPTEAAPPKLEQKADEPAAKPAEATQRSTSPPKRPAAAAELPPPPPPQHKERTASPPRGANPPRVDTFSFRTSPPASMEVDAPVVRVASTPRRRQHHHRQRAADRGDRQTVSLGPGGGTKRKVAMADFFDLSDLKDFEGFGGKGGWNGKDGGGGGGAGTTGGGGGKRARIN